VTGTPQVQAKSTGFIAYYRVSTDRQGRSGLGLEAQRAAVGRYLAGIGGILIAEHTEVETGRRNDRPELQKALAACRKHKARLVIAKLDRLSRNVAFIATMMDAGVEFVACDNPHATRLTLHILAAVAEHEREMISARTKAALQAAKARGVRLGRNAERLAPANRAAALDHANQIKGVLAELNRSGMTNREIAAELTARGITTPRGGRWHPQTVRRVMERVALFSAQSTATINIIESRSLRNPEK
jgi:DNA invertase Pin-like site-specific DNA recombinase